MKYELTDIINCPVCGTNANDLRNIELPPDTTNNFYVEAVSHDLNINIEELNKDLKIIKCGICHSNYYDKWFNYPTSNKIFNLVYGQHNYGWTNYYEFINSLILPNHGDLFNNYFKSMGIKTYGEFNCPFSGLFFHILNSENFLNKKFTKTFHEYSMKYFLSRQCAKANYLNEKKEAFDKNNFHLKKLEKLKSEVVSNELIKKYLIMDASSHCWDYNCLSESGNCKSIGQLLLGYDVIYHREGLDLLNQFDAIGLFMVFDHLKNPMAILNSLIKKSRYLIIHIHTSNNSITKQHVFSFSKDFIKYLKSNNIFSKDITPLINKDKNRNKGENFKDNQSYIICSQSSEYLSIISN